MKLNGKRRKVWWLLAIVVLALAVWGWRILNAPLPQYQTLVVRKGDLQQSVLATGKLDALKKVDVGAQVSGQLKTLRVEIGDKVKKDQLLGVIDPEQAENQIKEVEATLMELRAQLNQARAERKLSAATLARQQQLAQRQLVSRQDLDTAATDLAVKEAQIGTIEAQVKRNQATLDTAKTNLDYTKILAPMSGEVTQITTLQGQTVIAAQQAPNILTLVDLSTMLVKAQVSEADVIHLKPGQKAWFTVLGDPLTRYEGTLKDILPTPEKVNDAIFYYARFEVPNPQGILRLEMTAQVHIQLSEVKNVITIPLSALGEAIGDNRYHVRLLRTGEVKEREIVIGARNDTDVAVVKGLDEGDEVIIGEGAVRSGEMTALLELRDIRRSYPSGDGNVEVLKGITLNIAAGEMVAIVGASGSGKSTLMNILGCLDKPTGGTYRVAGTDVARLNGDELARLRREHFGFIFQRYHLLSHLTAAQNVEVPAVYAGAERKARLARAHELLVRLGLGDRAEYQPSQLSGGTSSSG